MAVVGAGIWTILALVGAGSTPLLPDRHAVLIAIKPTAGSLASGEVRLVWYRQGHVLVLTLTLERLPARQLVRAWLVPEGSCAGDLPQNARRAATGRSSASGTVQMSNELLGVTDLRFSAWSVWVQTPNHVPSSAACGVIGLGQSPLK